MSAATPAVPGPGRAPGSAPAAPALGARRAQVVAFRAMCERDLWVIARRDLAGFLAQALLQPLFYLFIFGRVLPEIGAARTAYGTQLLPGILGLTLFLTALQNTSLPLVIDFAFVKEIEDRLLAPLPAWGVGLQKVLMASLRGLVAALIILPLGALILPGGIHLGDASWIGFAGILIGGALAGSCLGLVLGTAVQAQQINVVFAVVLTPLIFTGATFYPWERLGGLEWFQVITLLNPLTYVSEGLRGALTTAPHLATGWTALGVVVSIVVFGYLGLRGFERRAID